MQRMALVLASALALSGCKTTSNPDVEKTWRNGLVAVPEVYATGMDSRCTCSTSWSGCYGEVRSGCLDHIPGDPKLPVVVFAHGCTGHNNEVVKQFVHLNYITVAPYSFARPGRKMDCKAGSNKEAIIRFRLQEIQYAVEQLRALPWVNEKKLILAGFSEGGTTAALYQGDEFSARMIFGWSCHTRQGNTWWDGIRGPSSTPVLAIEGADDPYLRTNPGSCRVSSRPHSESIVLIGRFARCV